MRITIITASLNAYKDIIQTAESLPITFPEWLEWIVIDGGSTDATIDTLKNDNRISSWISEKDNSVYEAYNKGLKLASGTHVWFLNCGDTMEKNGLKTLTKLISEEKSNTTHCFPVKIINRNYTWNPKIDDINNTMSIPTPGVIFLKKALSKIGGFNEHLDIASDYETLLKLYQQNYELLAHKETLTKYPGGGLSDKHHVLGFFEEVAIRLKNKTITPNTALFQAMRHAVFKIYTTNIAHKRWRIFVRIAKKFLY